MSTVYVFTVNIYSYSRKSYCIVPTWAGNTSICLVLDSFSSRQVANIPPSWQRPEAGILVVVVNFQEEVSIQGNGQYPGGEEQSSGMGSSPGMVSIQYRVDNI